MKNLFTKSTLAIVMGFMLLTAGCTSSTVIKSIPDEAKVYLNDEFVGTTPYRMTDDKISLSNTYVELKKEGYQDFSTVITKDENFNAGACAGGVFFLFPYLWILDYKPSHTYELIPLSGQQPPVNTPSNSGNTIKL